MKSSLPGTLQASVFLFVLAGSLPAQGKFVNYEDPQVKPIAVATVGSFDYVLACNTPDNSVEVYRAEWNLQAPIARVPVGLSPVTVKWDPTTGCFFTCNFLGDSVSRVRLDLVPATSTTPETVDPVLEQTEWVGNEPSDIAFDLGTGDAVITLHAEGRVRRIQRSDLALQPSMVLGDFAPGHVLSKLIPWGPNISHPNHPDTVPMWFLKQARRIEILPGTPAVPGNRYYVLNTMGGELSSRSPYDLGIFAVVPNGIGGNAFHMIRKTGSTNLGFVANAANDRLFVVSQIAKNDGNNGVVAVNGELTGFVQTWLQVVDLSSSTPALESEWGSSPPGRSINLNRDYNASGVSPVAVGERLAQVTDVILIPDPAAAPERVVLAAFGSDRVAIFTEDSSARGGYQRMFVDIPPIVPANWYSAVGPRGLAWSATASEPGAGTSGLVFVLNRLDNSLAVVGPATGNVTRRALASDPTPPNIRAGRKFLYTAAATSGGFQEGMVSCSSCHVDARTDGLRWRLGDLHAGGAIPPALVDGFDPTPLGSPPHFPIDKPEIVTQTLQGLVNYHLEPDGMQFMATNAPYHWRGDKATFQEFNEAFVNLQGMPLIGGALGPTAVGISSTDMDAYAFFINTIHHPPNPEQLPERTYSGSTGNVYDITSGSGGLLGRKLFHIHEAIAGRSCVNCHSLPEGSSNTLTETVLVHNTQSSMGTPIGVPDSREHPMETAALRNVVARELVVPDPAFVFTEQAFPIWPVNGSSGLLHGGPGSLGLGQPVRGSLSLNDNAAHNFLFALPSDPNPLLAHTVRAAAVTEFMRQLDTGTAPLVGFAWSMYAGAAVGDQRFDLACGQAMEANVGVAALQRVNGVTRGFWYDVTTNQWLEENGTGLLSEDRLVQQLVGPDDLLVVQVTPAGSERRVASLTGFGVPLASAQPSNVTLLPMVPNTAFVGITDLEGNIDPFHPGPSLPFVPAAGAPQPSSMLAQRTLANAAATAVPGGFGVPTQLRHEPPRRFRVAGTNIMNGAKLGLECVIAPGAYVWFDLTPTNLRTAVTNLEIWETTEELDAMHTLALLCGGYLAPDVLAVMHAVPPTPLSLQPATYNLYRVSIWNENGQTGFASAFVPLEIADVR